MRELGSEESMKMIEEMKNTKGIILGPIARWAAKKIIKLFNEVFPDYKSNSEATPNEQMAVKEAVNANIQELINKFRTETEITSASENLLSQSSIESAKSGLRPDLAEVVKILANG
jgi:hypothetical protein